MISVTSLVESVVARRFNILPKRELAQQKTRCYAYLGDLLSLIEGQALMRAIAEFHGNQNEPVFHNDAVVMLHCVNGS